MWLWHVVHNPVLLQEAEHSVQPPVYYEYMYAPASTQTSYDGVGTAAAENMQAQNSVA